MNTIIENTITNIHEYEHVFEDSDSMKMALIKEKSFSLAQNGQNPNLPMLLDNIPIMECLKIYRLCFRFIENSREECANKLIQSFESHGLQMSTNELKRLLCELEVLYASDVARESEADVIKYISDDLFRKTADKRFKLLRDYSQIYSFGNIDFLLKWVEELTDLINKSDNNADSRNIAYLVAVTVQRAAIAKYGKTSVITQEKISALFQNDYYDDNYSDEDESSEFIFPDDLPSIYVPNFCNYIREYHCPEIYRVFSDTPYWFDSHLTFRLYQAVQEYKMRYKYINDIKPLFKSNLSFCHYNSSNRFNTCFDDDMPQD